MVATGLKSSLVHGWRIFADRSIGSHIPYLRPVANGVIGTKTGCLLSTIRLNGFSFETADIDEINLLQKNRNTALRAIASLGSFSLYSHTIRRKVRPTLPADTGNPFITRLDAQYQRHIARHEMFVNDLYLTLVIRPLFAHDTALSRLLPRGRDAGRRIRQELCDRLAEGISALVKTLDAYGPKPLRDVERYAITRPDGSYFYQDRIPGRPLPQDGKTAWFCEQAEFLHALLNAGRMRPVRLGASPLDQLLPGQRISIGNRCIHLEGPVPDHARFAALVSLKDYPAETGAGMLDYVLQLPHEMILTQSLSFLDDLVARGRIDRLDRQLAKADEAGSSLQDDLVLARDQLARKEVAFAEHHLTLMPIAASTAALDDAVADIGAQLGAIGASYVREDFNCEPCYWAQLPGNHAYIARRAVISTLNFAGFASFHAYPYGRPDGNHWGPAITIFETTSGTPFFFNFHERDVGHTTVFGPTGSGKTVVMAFLVLEAHRVDRRLKTVIFDKDRGLDPMVRAVGGTYLTLDPGRPSGWNPLLLPDTARNRAFLLRLVGYMLKPDNGTSLSAQEEAIIASALATILTTRDIAMRRLSSLKTLFDGRQHSDGGLSARLDKWIGHGPHAWLFDNERDAMDLRSNCIGFDMTRILETPALRTAALLYMFHRLDEIYDGAPVINLMDEAWRLLDDDVFIDFLKDYFKTIRKRNGMVIFGTQSASDVVESKVARTIIEQTSTNIFFANAKADIPSYRRHFSLSRAEFDWVKNADPASHFMLIKHAKASVIARLDLSHMMDFVKVLSGRETTVRECEALRQKYGDDPSAWLPAFCGWPPQEGENHDHAAP
ncbi:type IV secretion system protein VirB4 [Phyllobacterium myrsinacearum]|uniref:VirB4 family type IV secretion/conjugal transfer ATPase n=1 Tax=Phyllobacterium myrsinacearum TaxID=28101 RepID=UPI00102A9BB3|nr:VirB4 family type IV secretion/conjugal transfer ATPase [Phyllobacterium myrsinacearum]RZS70625.1 type IV secretion system protein VirB4 [Phyllobacterium myrsinacearum]